MKDKRFNDFFSGGQKERWSLLIKIYNTDLSCTENLKQLQEKGIYLTRSSLMEFIRYYNIDSKKYLKLKHQRILDLYDKTKTYKENLQLINDSGEKCSMGTLYYLVNKKN